MPSDTNLELLGDRLWVPAGGVHAVHFALIDMVQDLVAEQIGSAVGRRAGQDPAGGLRLLDLLDGFDESHRFT